HPRPPPFRSGSPSGPPPPLHQHQVHGEPVQPRGNRALPAKRRPRAPRLHEHVLRALLGLGGAPRESEAEERTQDVFVQAWRTLADRKSTRLNSSHVSI